jgi:hypothetical protein
VYTFIRTDLPIEQQIVQAAHSALEAGRDLGKPTTNSHLILLEAKSEDSLLKIAAELTSLDIKYRIFHEPDDDRGYTSLTTEPLDPSAKGREYFRKHSLYKFRASRAFSQSEEFI